MPDIGDPAFGAAFDRFVSARVVLMGEGPHGTSEFYRARATMTRRLIERYGLSLVAVEADWPDVAAIDHYVRLAPYQPTRATPFTRFPTRMWRNRNVDDLVGFLRRHNLHRSHDDRVAFYGLDLFCTNTSMAAVLGYLDRVDPEASQVARSRYGCLTPWSRELAA